MLDVLASVVNPEFAGEADLTRAYTRILRPQMATVRWRHAAGSGSVGPDKVVAALQEEIAAGLLPPGARRILAEACQGEAASGARAGGDVKLDQVMVRIQALRAKTTGQGCTEQEARAAAKVAELLDTHGLSLSSMDLRR